MIGVRVPNARLSHDLRNIGRMIVIGGQTKCDPYPSTDSSIPIVRAHHPPTLMLQRQRSAQGSNIMK